MDNGFLGMGSVMGFWSGLGRSVGGWVLAPIRAVDEAETTAD